VDALARLPRVRVRVTLAAVGVFFAPVWFGGCDCDEGGADPVVDASPMADAAADVGLDGSDGADADADAADGGGDGQVPSRGPVVFQVAGGGASSSKTYRARVSAGAPVPTGLSRSAAHRVSAGPPAAAR
jgi:hypothetical protein